MTATDELRRMLDERGVEHYDRLDVTEWVGADYEICHTNAIYSNGVSVLVLRKCTTPEQAVEATLSRGTCHLIDTKFPTGDDSYFKACSGCGFWIHNKHGWEKTHYCPNCGRKVVDE